MWTIYVAHEVSRKCVQNFDQDTSTEEPHTDIMGLREIWREIGISIHVTYYRVSGAFCEHGDELWVP